MPETINFTDGNSRRDFITKITALIGAEALLSIPFVSKASVYFSRDEMVTVKEIIDRFIQEVPGGEAKQTVDNLKSGSADTKVTGIVTSMFATIDVIKKTIALGANFIVAHEPTFYSHEDDTTWLKTDPVYQYKWDLLQKNKITVWRCHDYIHRLVPDPVSMAVLDQLQWKPYADKSFPNLVTLAPSSLRNLIGYLKQRFAVEKVRYIGNLDQVCSKVIYIPGAAGIRMQSNAVRTFKPDVLICGEISEWEAGEYVRDARAKGDNVSIIVIGHVASEEAGSIYMMNWLQEKFPSIKTTHIPAGNSLSFL
jgi:putative NIF3 family GTP cyclohydrolase 1 type 2